MKCITRKHSEFSFFSYPRFVGFAAAKGPEKKAEVKAEGFKAPESADKKPLDELKKSEDLKMGQIEGAHMKVKADVQKAKEAAKANFEKSPKADADKKAYEAFVGQMDKMNTDADQARVDLFSKLDAQNDAKREKERKAADERMKSALLGKDVQISKMEQKGKFVAKLEAQATTPHANKDATDAVMANMDNHDFDGDDFQDNSDPSNKYINYQNKSRSMAEGYLRAQIAMGQQGKGEKDLQAAYNADEGFGPELLRDHTITEENLRKQMDIEAFMKTVDVSSSGTFLTDNERIYVATLMKESASLWGSDNKDTKQYRDFVQARLTQITPLLQANKQKATLMLASVDHSTISKGVGVVTAVPGAVVGGVIGLGVGAVPGAVGGYEAGRRMTRGALTPDAIRDAYNQCAEYERNLVMNTIPAPKEWVDHKDKYQDNPEVSEMEVKMRTEYIDKVKTFVPRAEALWAFSDAGVIKKYIDHWQTDIDHGLERNADGSFVRKDMTPENIVKWGERMKSEPTTFIDGWKRYLQTEGPKYPTASAKAAELVASLEDIKNNFDGKKPEDIRDIMKRVDRMNGNIEDGLYGPAQAVPEGGAPAPVGPDGKPVEPGKPGETPKPAVGPDGKPVPAADSTGGGKGGGRRGGKGGGTEGGKGEKGKEGTEKDADQLKEDAIQLEADTTGKKKRFDAMKDKKAGDADVWAKKAAEWKATADKWVEKAKNPKIDALKSQKDATDMDTLAKKAVEDLRKVAPAEKAPDAVVENAEKTAADRAKKLAGIEKGKFDAVGTDNAKGKFAAAEGWAAKAGDWVAKAEAWLKKTPDAADAKAMKVEADAMVTVAKGAVDEWKGKKEAAEKTENGKKAIELRDEIVKSLKGDVGQRLSIETLIKKYDAWKEAAKASGDADLVDEQKKFNAKLDTLTVQLRSDVSASIKGAMKNAKDKNGKEAYKVNPKFYFGNRADKMVLTKEWEVKYNPPSAVGVSPAKTESYEYYVSQDKKNSRLTDEKAMKENIYQDMIKNSKPVEGATWHDLLP